jgi:hypothetical protein
MYVLDLIKLSIFPVTLNLWLDATLVVILYSVNIDCPITSLSSQSAKTNFNVEDVFFCIVRDMKQSLAKTDSKPEVIVIYS